MWNFEKKWAFAFLHNFGGKAGCLMRMYREMNLFTSTHEARSYVATFSRASEQVSERASERTSERTSE